MDQHNVKQVLEFDKVMNQLTKHTASSLGAEAVAALTPVTTMQEAYHLQEETDEAVTVIRLKGHMPLAGIHDIRQNIKHAEIGGMLQPTELLNIGHTIYGSRRVRGFIRAMVADDIQLPSLQVYTEQLVDMKELEQTIQYSIDDQGQVADQASRSLQNIRQTMRTTERHIRNKLDNILRSSDGKKMLSDTVMTIRNGRFVLPVKQEYRGHFGGMVHDQSSSGATLFVEPSSVVALNNQRHEAESKETKEIERILQQLTGQVAAQAELLLQNIEMLQTIDFIFAKAYYAQSLRASKPRFNEKGILSLKRARHPLISEDEVEPVDIAFGEHDMSLIITGPNTGGKTVALKTIGLLTLMAQSGLQIPVQDGSDIAVFQKVFADIGDEQSIEQSLSTFSSHMTTIIDMLQHVDEHSLVLFDELGAGTDPQEGAALAIAILDEVYERGALTAATTHYSELKAYAYEREGVLNASVEFDIQTLQPTYRLLMGIPGRSNAFEISEKLGMSSDLIRKARANMSQDSNKVNHMIASLENNQKQAEQDRQEAARVLADYQQKQAALEKEQQRLENERQKILQAAERKGREAVAATKQQATEIINQLRESQKNQEHMKEHQFIDKQKQLDAIDLQLSHQTAAPKGQATSHPSRDLQEGDEVNVISLGQKATIVDILNEDECLVQVGMMKMNTDKSNLEQAKPSKKEPERTVVSVGGRDNHVTTTLDLRGKRYEDAIQALDKYFDEVLLAGYPQISIIHGKGTGALRKGVQKYLKNHPHVAESRAGGMGEGGIGVTIVTLQ